MANDDPPRTEATVLVEALKVVEPLVSASKDGQLGVARLFKDMGLSDDLVGQDIGTIAETIQSDVSTHTGQLDSGLATLAGQSQSAPDIGGISDIDQVDWTAVSKEVGPGTVLTQVQSLVGATKGVFKTVETLQAVDIDDDDLGSVGDQLFDYLLIRYLKQYHGPVYGYLKTFGVITSHEGNHGTPETIELGAIPAALEDPNDIPQELLGWAKRNEPFQATVLLERLLTLFGSADLPVRRVPADVETLTGVTGEAEDKLDTLDVEQMDGWGDKLLIPLFGKRFEDGKQVEAGVKIVPLPPRESQQLPGIALVTYGQLEAGMSGPLGSDWNAAIDGDGRIANRGVAINPGVDSGLTVTVVNTASGAPGPSDTTGADQFVFTADLDYVGDGLSERAVVGTAAGSVLVDGLSVSSRFEYVDDTPVLDVALSTTGTLQIDPQGGFLDTIIPKPLSYDFDVTVGWSSASGLYLQNGGTLQVTLANAIPLGPLRITETFLGLDLGSVSGGAAGETSGDSDPQLPVVAATTPKLDIGFLTAEVRRIGVEATLSAPESGDGTLGPLDFDLGFKPPESIEVSVDAGTVSGSGLLRSFPDDNRYSGTLQLSVGPLSLTAVGLLKTELPSGDDGYSFLVMLTGDFPPIQLGFGFTLEGVGGLFGLHRGMKTDTLGTKVRTGNLDSVLFPDNVVENAQRIISDLRAIFPPKQDHHVVGPMVKMAWGTPTLLTMEVGVVLELPPGEIAIVGAFHLNLPDENAPLVEINLSVLGVLDPPDQRLAVDASLYDSRLVAWSLSGDMAMRLRWGEDSTFLLSVGGFHPRYDPPKGFPELDRVKASLGAPGGNPRIELEGYLATTPNTFQVGAGVYLHAEAGPATVKGALAFDALFQFDPFKFVIDFLAKLSVKVKGTGLAIEIDGRLQGPGPMRVSGTVSFEIAIISVSANIDVTLGSGGDTEKLPRTRVMPELTEALDKPGNWATQVPDSIGTLVSVRERNSENSDGESDKLLTHPLGGLEVRQTVVPLGDPIEKFGNTVPKDYEEFRIADISLEEISSAPVREKFAPAKYKKLKDSEKINSPSFVRREAGRRAGSGMVYISGDEDPGSKAQLHRSVKLSYETTVIDEQEDIYGQSLGTLGRFAGMRPMDARFGVPLENMARLLRESAPAVEGPRQNAGVSDPDMDGLADGRVGGSRPDRTVPEGLFTDDSGDADSSESNADDDDSNDETETGPLLSTEGSGVINIGGDQ